MALRSHIPMAHSLPIFIIRIIQLVLAVCIIGILAYLAYYYNYYFGDYTSVYSGAIGLGIFSGCVTLIANIYYLVAGMRVHKMFNAIAVITLDAFLVLFWLITFALCAKSTADFHAYDNTPYYTSSSSGYTYTYGGHTYECYSDGSCTQISKRGLEKRAASTSAWTGIYAAALALSIIEWFLFIATLVMVVLGFHRSSKTNTVAAPSMEQTSTAAPTTQPQSAPITHYDEHTEMPQQH